MKIRSMKATFGKLEHDSLTLEPGLNIIDAPNEWGKSTWCAFLVTMLYGLDTSQRNRKGALADKERYQPWSGSPMSGVIELCWQGRQITIQRGPKGRVPMGAFRAYETDTGLPVPELTGENCGQVLLGVERSVFLRAGFIRSAEMPVTQDEDLRTRLNALVTTGEENSSAEELGQRLRELKNRCQYNKKGLLPEARARLEALEEKRRDGDGLADQSRQLRRQQEALEQSLAALENHRMALDHQASMEDAQRVLEAQTAQSRAEARLREAERACQGLPSRESLLGQLRRYEDAQRQWAQRMQTLPEAPVPPQVPEVFRGIDPEEAVRRATADRAAARRLRPGGGGLLPILFDLGVILAVAGGAVAFRHLIWGLVLAGLGAAGIAAAAVQVRRRKMRLSELCQRYGSTDPEGWQTMARRYQQDWERYHEALARSDAARQSLEGLRQGLEGDPQLWKSGLEAWDGLREAEAALTQARQHSQAVRAMAKTAPPPEEPDRLTCSRQETDRRLAQTREQLRQLQLKLGQCQGRMELLGSREQLDRELASARERVGELELTYRALERGLQVLTDARAQLQRRFAPRLTKLAQQYFARLTAGRYQRLTLGEDLSIHTASREEDGLRSHLWRSEGTVDQLYLALRLAVAKELTPTAPLILDDALIRFDDTRLAEAMQILREEARQKQVIVFTCQGREK